MTILETGRRKKANGFTLLELLIAMAVLVTALTLIAVGFSRQLFALRLLEDSLTSHHLAEELLVREVLQREKDLDVPLDSVEGFTPSANRQTIQISRGSLSGLEMDLLTAEVSWNLRGVSRSSRMTAGFPKKREGPAQ